MDPNKRHESFEQFLRRLYTGQRDTPFDEEAIRQAFSFQDAMKQIQNSAGQAIEGLDSIKQALLHLGLEPPTIAEQLNKAVRLSHSIHMMHVAMGFDVRNN